MAVDAPRLPRPALRTTTLAVVVVVGAVVAWMAVRPTGHTPRTCNGSARLCDRRLDQVAFATTHNSMNAAADGFLYPDQDSGIAAQLDAGVRGFLLDALLGSVRRVGDHDIVYTDLDQGQLESRLRAVGSEAQQRALQLREEAGPPPDDAPRDVYLCHAYCELGAVPFATVVDELRSFLEDHPDAVLVVVIQDELPAEQLLPVLEKGGLDPYLSTLDPTQPLPTMGSMVDSGRRLVMGLELGDLGPRIPNVYDAGLVQDVPYRYSSVGELEDEASCRPHRGSADAPLLLLNHWITPATPETASEANTEHVLLGRAERCADERGQPVNLLAVNFYETGDLLNAVDRLNGN
jgi:hypothetical protein